jgi:hypothetical protein
MIERVLETSLVYRGAINDTSVSKELKAGTIGGGVVSLEVEEPTGLKDLSELGGASQLLVTPFYDGLTVKISMIDGRMKLCRFDGALLDDDVCNRFDLDQFADHEELYGLLVPYRGKERLRLSELNKLLNNQPSQVSRLELKLVPRDGLDLSNLSENGSPNCVRVLRHKVVSVQQVDETARDLMTRDGVRLWKLDELPPKSVGYRYSPVGEKQPSDSYRVCCQESLDRLQTGSDNMTFMFTHDGTERQFVIRQGNQARLARGARFVADEVMVNDRIKRDLFTEAKGRLVELSRSDGGYLLKLSGGLEGWFALRRIKLDGQPRYLFYRRGVIRN